MFRNSLCTGILPLAVVAALGLTSGCADDAGVAAPETTSSGIALAGIGLPATAAMAEAVGATDAQRSSLGDARARWNEAASGQPLLGFLQEASTFLDHAQMLALTQLLGEERAGMQQCRREGQRHGRRGGPGVQAGAMGAPRILEWADALALSDEQRAAILEHHESVRPAMQELRGDRGTPPGAGKREQMRALQGANRAWLEQLLSDEQKQKLEQLRAERRDWRRSQNAERHALRAGERLDSLDQILGLDDGQRAQIEKLLAAQKEEMDSLRAGRGAGPVDTQAFGAIRTATREQISGVLNADQRELFAALDGLTGHGARGQRGCAGERR